MTADKKAKELVMHFHKILTESRSEGINYKELIEIDAAAKQCAIKAVDFALNYSVKEDTAELLKLKQSINKL